MIKDELEKTLREALRQKDDNKKRTIRLALSTIKLAEVEKRETLDDVSIAGILQKEIKSRRETILDSQKANRQDLVDTALAEIAILEEYLPKPFTEKELHQLVDDAIQEIGASLQSDIGKVMKILLPKLQGRAANDLVSQMVRSRLQK